MTFPPGPRLPALGQFAEWWLRPLPFLEACARKLGPTFTLDITGLGRFVVVTAPEDVRAVLAGAPDRFHGGEANSMLLPVVGPGSLILLDEAPYLRHRRLVLPPMHGERLQVYARLVRDTTDEVIARWPVGRPFPILPEAQKIVWQVMLRAVVGVPDPLAPVAAAIQDVLNMGAKPWVLLFQRDWGRWSPGGRLRRVLAHADELIYAYIARRRAEPVGEDILSLLLAARDEDGSALSDRDVRDELVTLLIAGSDTTAVAASWTVAFLAADPTAAERARTDADYLDAAIREALRLRPIFTLSIRQTVGPERVGGYDLPAGTVVAPCIYLCGQRHDEPGRFMPERFLGVKPDPLSWFPFGGGVRRCVGMAFALFLLRNIVGRMLQRTRLRGDPPRTGRRHILIVPAGGGMVTRDDAP